MPNLKEIFGSDVFNDEVMQERLPKDTYKAMRRTIENGRSLDPQVANVVAHAMKDWAIERGVTHFTHWFQPMTGITAEKHDAFINPQEGGRMIQSFSGKELVRGEPDASSFPSGGLRTTFEARGYTAWDPTSYAFIKDGVLCIPTAFCSYGGEALDMKTPLLRSMEALSKQAVRVLHLFGRNDVTRVITTVGPEQEYFLVDEKLWEKRMDLMLTGRTLFGAKPLKGQELSDHYFGNIKPRVHAFMKEMDVELWKLGILSKTEHNEAAPAQHEMAPIFSVANIATDHNQLTMEIMKKVARRHGLVCLLHEKPYEGVNGSGKHNNWSMCTNTGYNLLEPGDSPYDSAQFMLFLTAVIKAVDDYQDLLRISVASASNDHRLGGYEAPPAIISIFLGDELGEIIDALESGSSYKGREHSEMTIGVHVLPKLPKDTTDRNRTSPFAFTGNKFEFRSLGSSASIADANITLNTIVAEVLKQFADELEGAEDFHAALHDLIIRTIRQHKRIIFNGNNYSEDWVNEAASRGLLNLPSTVDALPHMVDEKNIRVFENHRVFNSTEIRSRYEIKLDSYTKLVNIEAETALYMAQRQILPACIKYIGQACRDLTAGGLSLGMVDPIREGIESLNASIRNLHNAMTASHGTAPLDAARYEHDTVIPAMNAVRAAADALEPLMPESEWPMPNYTDLIFRV